MDEIKQGTRVLHKGHPATVEAVSPARQLANITYDRPGRNTGLYCGCHKDGHIYAGAYGVKLRELTVVS